MATQKPPKSIRFPDDVQEAIEKKAKQRQRSFQWIVIDGMRNQLIDKKKKVSWLHVGRTKNGEPT